MKYEQAQNPSTPQINPIPTWRSVANVVIQVGIVALLIAAANTVYGPIIIQASLLLLMIYAVRHRWIGQLSDIFSRNSAAEAGRRQFKIGSVHTTWNWIFNIALVASSWLFILYVLYLINQAQDQFGVQIPEVDKRPGLIQFMDGNGDIHERYVRLLLWTWLIASLPAFLGIFSLLGTRARFRMAPEKQDLHGMAMLGTYALLGLLDLAVTECWLGFSTGLRWGLPLLSLLPLFVLIVRLFSPVAWTETGKEILNATPPSVQTLPEPTRTLAFLQVPPALPASHTTEAPPDFHERLRARNNEGPVILVCASGGGSRAALFTAGILNRMWWQTVPEALLSKSELAALAALSESERQQLTDTTDGAMRPGRLLLQNADAFSSVSGGSLASSYFVESLHRLIRDAAPAGSAWQQRHEALRTFFEPAGLPAEQARPATVWYTEKQKPGSLRDFFTCSSTQLTFPRISGVEAEQKKFEAHPYINAMRQDHLAACMTGFFIPGTGRGPGIELFWEERFRWYANPQEPDPKKRKPLTLQDFYPMERDGRLPVLILNGTLARTGTRVAITNLHSANFHGSYKFGPMVDKRDLGEGAALNQKSDDDIGKGRSASLRAETNDADAAIRQASHRYDPLPAQINTLNELDARWYIPLKSATRASANFLVGFPLMRFYRRYATVADPKQSIVPFQNGPDVLEISDGGVLDNTGVDSAMALLRANKDEIKKRGVLIFQIDSGELPRDPKSSALNPLLHHIMEVKNALWRANLNAQSALHSLYLDELESLFDDSVEEVKRLTSDANSASNQYILGYAGQKAAFFVVRAGELEQDHVMTSWHLDAEERAKLYEEVGAPQQGEAILCAAAWALERMRKNATPGEALPPAKVEKRDELPIMAVVQTPASTPESVIQPPTQTPERSTSSHPNS